MKKMFFFFWIVGILSSCVSSKQFNEVAGNLQNCRDENRLLQEKNQELIVRGTELQGSLDKLREDFQVLQEKWNKGNEEAESLRRAGNRLGLINAELEGQLETLKNGSSEEISRLMEKLQHTQADIQEREDKLHQAEFELAAKNKRLAELQEALDKQEEAVKQLKENVIGALTGFNNNGLSINERNGKVYVSVDEQLLFKTAQWKVDEKGRQALRNLAELLARNPDINILVEGHTDDVPMRGSGEVKDNWDLSVMRATAVTKILLENKTIDPQRITSAGRGEFVPLVDGKASEDRQKNRRTEIILSPRLDEIFRLLEGN
ncbi:MAG: OmpA family protein [Prolixibacteraceae bacterium]|jgi:chemotaxis protein MotB|nr:OmpA family protein [Prolixibacteraceae bacterium]